MLNKLPPGLMRLTQRLPAIPLPAPNIRPALDKVLKQAADLLATHLPSAPPPRPATPYDNTTAGSVVDVAAFGDNPGGLRMRLYVPRSAPAPGAPLIVVMHGCGQNAAVFAADTGWTAMADRIGAPLLLPEQVSENNQGRCFNWFLQADIARTGGEMQSIRSMVAEAVRRFGSDPRRVFAVGLSAGGAMVLASLAAYPEVFAAGAVVAGLPVGGARNVPSAMSLMAGNGPRLAPAEWAERARALAPTGFSGPWPRLSVWQGTRDHTVAPSEAETITAQWSALLGLAETPPVEATIAAGVRRRAWGDRQNPALESWTVEGMSHGYPIEAGRVTDRFVLPGFRDATADIAHFWRIAPPR